MSEQSEELGVDIDFDAEGKVIENLVPPPDDDWDVIPF